MEFFCQHPHLPLFTLLLAIHPLPLHPPQTPLVGLPLWIEERGLTKVSMVTVHSVNHAAADVSSPSLLPSFPFPPSIAANLVLVHNRSLPFSSPLVCSFVYSLHLILTFCCNLKSPFPVIDIIGGGGDGEDIMFT